MRNRLWMLVAAVLMVLLAATMAVSATKGTAPKSKPAKPKPPAMPRIVDLGSKQCIPCKMMIPVLEQLKTEYKGKLQVEVIDVVKSPGTMAKYKARTIPTQILYSAKGKEIARHMGFWPKKDILAEFQKHGIKLVPNPPPPKNKP